MLIWYMLELCDYSCKKIYIIWIFQCRKWQICPVLISGVDLIYIKIQTCKKPMHWSLTLWLDFSFLSFFGLFIGLCFIVVLDADRRAEPGPIWLKWLNVLENKLLLCCLQVQLLVLLLLLLLLIILIFWNSFF